MADSEICLFGSSNFRHCLALSILSGKSIQIKDIGLAYKEKGITDAETCLLHLIDKISNSTTIRISDDGNSLYFKPGLILGGEISHKCDESRGIGYFLEFIIWISVLIKVKTRIVFEGVTNHNSDPSVDLINTTTIPILKRFGFEMAEIKVLRRGSAPRGGGCVIFTCSPVSKIKAFEMTSIGKIKKIRGTAFTMRVSPNIGSTLIEHSKGLLLKYIPDIFITSDHCKGPSSGLSPGFGLSLIAETTNGSLICGEAVSEPKGNGTTVNTEELANKACYALFEEISSGSCIPSFNHTLVLLYMAVNPSGVSRVLLSNPSPYIIDLIRLIRKFLGVVFKIKPGRGEEVVNNYQIGTRNFVFSCLGAGLSNTFKSRS